MKKQSLYTVAALVALSLGSINLAQAQNLSLTAVTSVSITGAPGVTNGVITSVNGISTVNLILGTTTYFGGGASANGITNSASLFNYSYYADDYSLATSASSDGTTYVQTLFAQAVTQIFFFEKNGNDSGTLEALDINGNVIGNSIPYVGHPTSYWTDTGYKTDTVGATQEAYDLAILSDTPIYGVRFVNGTGIDPISVMAVAPVPEPTTVALLGLGAVLLLRRKR
jgi:hypothetical protein